MIVVMDGSIGGRFENYLVAFAAVAVAAIATALFWPLPASHPLILFYGAVVVAAWRGGLGPSLAAMVLSALAGAYFFLTAYGSFQLAAESASALFVFVCAASLIGWLVAGWRSPREQERALRLWIERLVENIPEGAAVIDPAGRITHLNPIAERITGWSRDEARGELVETVFQILDEQTRERRDLVAEVLAAGEGASPRDRSILISKNGAEISVSASAAPIRGPSGAVAGAIMVVRGDFARKLAEEGRRRTEELNRKIIDASDACLKVLDLDGRIQMINEYGASLLEIENRAEWVGRNLVEGWPEEARETLRDAVRRAALGERVRFGGLGRTVKGTPKWWDVSIAPIPGVDGRFERLLYVGRDVTERKQIEDALRAGEERHRALLDSIDEGFCVEEIILDDHGRPVDIRLLETNPAFGIITGLGGVTGRTFRELNSGIDEDWLEVHGQVALTGEPLRFANLTPTASGRWYDVYAFRADRDDAHKVAFLFRNITESVLAERERTRLARDLENQRAELVRLVEKAPAFIAIMRGPDHIIELANKKAHDLVGGRELLGRSVASAVPEAAGQGFVDLLDRVYQTGEEYIANGAPFTVDRTGSDARETRYVNFVYQPMRAPDGSITGVFLHGVDVTEMVQAAGLLKESEARYRQLADAMPQAVWTTGPDGKFELCNQAWREYTGYANQDFSKSECSELTHPDDFERLQDEWSRALRAGTPFEAEFRFKRASDGEYRWHLSRALPVKDAGGEIVRWIGANIDIDDSKRLAETLRRADQRKDEFLATLAHELRNPLSPIRTGLQILKMKPNEDVAASTVEMMTRQLEHMTSLVDDLMDLARVGSGKINLRKERVTLQPIVETALERSRPSIQDRGHELTVRIAGEPIRLEADPIRIGQVVSNLLTNAAKYTEPGGRIEISADQEEGEAVIRVKDSGVGLEPEMLEKVFEMFSQVGSSIQNSQGGLGIGLTVVKRLVELHGGRIEATSDGPGFGSEFIVHLPLTAEEDERTDESAPSPSAGAESRLRVLVVDDNRDSADTLAKVVMIGGHDARTAYDGDQAMTVAESFRPNIVLLDIGLPGLNGYEIAERIRQNPVLRDAKLVAVTGWGQPDDRRRSREAGFDLHFVKPVDLTLLQTLLKSGVDAARRKAAELEGWKSDQDDVKPNG